MVDGSHANEERSARVAVVLVNYFSENYLAECLDSLRAQTRPPDRTIVVDNGGEEGRLDALLERFPEASLLRMPENVGFAAANNRAAEIAEDCRWLVLLNVDAFPEPSWLEELLRAADANADCAFFGSKLIDGHTATLLDGTGDVYHCSGRPWRRNHGESTALEQRQTAGTIGPCAAAAMYRRDCWLEVGGLDEGYFCYLEDVDLALRMRLAGYGYLHVPQAIVRHLGSGVTGRRSDFCVYHGHRNLVGTFVKNMPGRLFWKYLPQHLLLNLVAVIGLTLRGRGRAVFRAKLHALRNLPRYWRQREVIQATRRISVADFDALLARGLRTLVAKS